MVKFYSESFISYSLRSIRRPLASYISTFVEPNRVDDQRWTFRSINRDAVTRNPVSPVRPLEDFVMPYLVERALHISLPDKPVLGTSGFALRTIKGFPSCFFHGPVIRGAVA